jgi:Flp pilus assembly protein protease CpaA
MIVDLCFSAAFNTDFVTKSSYQELAFYTVVVIGIHTFAAYLLLRSHYMSVAFEQTLQSISAAAPVPYEGTD